jgi:hypothetical protein
MAKTTTSAKRKAAASALPETEFIARQVLAYGSNHARDRLFQIDVTHGRELALTVKELGVAGPMHGFFKLKAPTSKATSVFALYSWSHASANGKMFQLRSEPPRKATRIDGALLPFTVTDWLDRPSVTVRLGSQRYRLDREKGEHVVRLSVNGKRLAVPCVPYGHRTEDAALFIAREGPLRGMILLQRHTGDATRVKALDGEFAPRR